MRVIGTFKSSIFIFLVSYFSHKEKVSKMIKLLINLKLVKSKVFTKYLI